MHAGWTADQENDLRAELAALDAMTPDIPAIATDFVVDGIAWDRCDCLACAEQRNRERVLGRPKKAP